MNRRELLRLATIAPFCGVLSGVTKGDEFSGNRQLVLIELKGGNDGLNTLIPFQDSYYYRARPKIAIKPSSVQRLTTTMGMHPSLASLMPLWSDGHLAWAMGLGYPNPNRSHFRSIEIWETGSKASEYLDQGWIAQVLTRSNRPLTGVSLDNDLGPLHGHSGCLVLPRKMRFSSSLVATNLSNARNNNSQLKHILDVRSRAYKAFNILEDELSRITPLNLQMPKTSLSRQLTDVLRLQLTGLPIKVFKVSLGSFDTHINQSGLHANLLKQLAESLYAYSTEAKRLKLWDQTVLVTYSEFGRRVQENSSRGTDHGTAASHLVAGGAVNGGMYGKHPRLNQLDHGDLVYTIDFRSLYANLARSLLGPVPVEYRHHDHLNIV